MDEPRRIDLRGWPDGRDPHSQRPKALAGSFSINLLLKCSEPNRASEYWHRFALSIFGICCHSRLSTAETVPVEWRGQIIGTHNAQLAASSMVTSLIVGQVLSHLPFQTGYQVVFVIGWWDAMLSVFHIS